MQLRKQTSTPSYAINHAPPAVQTSCCRGEGRWAAQVSSTLSKLKFWETMKKQLGYMSQQYLHNKKIFIWAFDAMWSLFTIVLTQITSVALQICFTPSEAIHVAQFLSKWNYTSTFLKYRWGKLISLIQLNPRVAKRAFQTTAGTLSRW